MRKILSFNWKPLRPSVYLDVIHVIKRTRPSPWFCILQAIKKQLDSVSYSQFLASVLVPQRPENVLNYSLHSGYSQLQIPNKHLIVMRPFPMLLLNSQLMLMLNLVLD